MGKIRNVSPDALLIGLGLHGPRLVQPDEVVEVPDDAVPFYVERADGTGEYDDDGNPVTRVVASDLWVEVADVAPKSKPASEQE